jgi:Cu-Zn family superoxide dismutase
MVDVSHGMPGDSLLERHVGDLGNIETNANGSVYIDFADPVISIVPNNTRYIVGLLVMIHNLTNDGGHTGKGESNTTG